MSFFFLCLLATVGHVLSTGLSRHHQNVSLLMELETMGELYYQVQLEERTKDLSIEFGKIGANYPCLLGTYPVGGRGAVIDGHKFLCGLHAISGPPIVYCYGSDRDPHFENSLLEIRPDAEILVFELQTGQTPLTKDPRIKYYEIGLGGYDGKDKDSHGRPIRTMLDTMKLFNHTYVDILKMDIEGYEFIWMKNEGEKVLPRVGQFSNEVHINHTNYVNMYGYGPTANSVTYVTDVEKTGMRLFHKEINHGSSASAIEVSFIQQKWIEWDDKKKRLLPLP